MNFQKLSLILLISSASTIFAMEDLSISTMKRTAEQLQTDTAAKVAKLKKQIEMKEKEQKRTFAWLSRKIKSELDARDLDKALSKYKSSLDTIEQDGLKISKEYFTKTVLPHIATGDKERLLYGKKFVEKEIVALCAKRDKMAKDLATLSTSSSWNFFSWGK